MSSKLSITSVGLMGLGAFGRLVANHLDPHFQIIVHDPALPYGEPPQLSGRMTAGSAADLCRCDLIILAVPVDSLATAIQSLRPHLRPGCTVVDVASVKVRPIDTMLEELPPFVNIIGTHPLFGPRSAQIGIEGHKIALCPVRGHAAARRVAAFLRQTLGLQVFLTTADEHDREAAVVQGVTHLIAKVLQRMGPMPSRLTTTSFEQLMQATEMVKYDAPGVFLAIERENPHAAAIRDRFFALANEIREELEGHA